ncbi:MULTISPECIES: hypothetical protein [Haloferax]|uniref:Uncharacterized protein n=2 Tax=Haloferax TaxID=2251 RepID=A0A6G1Z0G7_9EURY|nr:MULTISPECIES: hypothetical protein [Haloferax]KAB1187485.1 hypothetical protein Hfx1149_05345 [Haloferax sp. CBA1149]MRW80137.1 hypothetical protein [Haloferax marinisediminis]
MPTTSVRRLVGILVLLGCLFGLLVWYGSLAPNPSVGAYPDSEDLGPEYDAWVGEQTSLTGTVVETDPLTIVSEYGTGELLRLQVTDADVDAQQGETLALYGVVEPDNTIRALNAYTVPSTNYVYMYGVSFLAGLWVLGRLARDWRLDWKTWSLEPRESPLSLRRGLVDTRQSTEDHDA